MKVTTKFLICLCVGVTSFLESSGQQNERIKDSEKVEVMEEIAKLMKQYYVFPEKIVQMEDLFVHRMGSYMDLKDPQAFASTIDEDLRGVFEDLHLRFLYDPAGAEMLQKRNASSSRSFMQEEQIKVDQKKNFGFVKVERLSNNIGYLDFRQFSPVSKESTQTVTAAMSFLENADAIIIDLRNNGGGYPEMVQLIMSHFFDHHPVHYNSIYHRPTDTTRDFSTLPEVPGPKMPYVDLYILTSKRTFSAAEEFAYNLQSLKRAYIIGEITAGGAHPTRPFSIGDKFVIKIPIARSINAVTKTNWEGKGVRPDKLVDSKEALNEAFVLALENLKRE